MPTYGSFRVRKHRLALRESGMRPLQIWVPDTRSQSFTKECQRQSLLAAVVDKNDTNLTIFMDDAISDIDGWEA